MTLYDDLELQPDCSFDDIKQQYRTLAKKYHPDLGGDAETFKRIKFAYEVLSDPVRRKQYDETKTTNIQSGIRKEAIDALANIFFSIIPNFNCNEGNLIATLRNEADSIRLKALADSAMNEKYIKNLEIVKSKLKVKDSSKEDIILAFIEKQLETRYRDRSVFEYRVKLSEELMLILENYDYGFLEIMNLMAEPVMENETKTQ
jgi:curved DNA-binding protein CbpA